jgi:hypothetical protein
MYPPLFARGSRSCVASHLPGRCLHRQRRGRFLLVTPEHHDIEAIAITAEKASDASELRITLGVLTSAERDFANTLLRAAWSAVLEETPASCCSTSSWKPTRRCPPTADDQITTHACGEIVGRPPPGPQLVRDGHCKVTDHAGRSHGARAMPGGWNAMNDRRDGPRWP